MGDLKQAELRQTCSLHEFKDNSRKHSERQIKQLARSIQEWGWTIPILVDESSTIIAGHGRLQAAKQLNIEEVPVIVASGWSDEQKRAYVIADNQLTLNADWDDDLLKSEIDKLTELDFNISLLGFPDEDSFTEEEPPEKNVIYDSVYEVSVTCSDEEDQRKVYNTITDMGYKCRVLSM